MTWEHTCRIEDAPRFSTWIRDRGGVAFWRSHDLSDLEKSWSTPATAPDGGPPSRPHWKASTIPDAVYTDSKKIGVMTDEPVKRFRVGVRMGGEGLVLKCSDASTRRIRREVARAGEGAYYVFDYATQECVIMRAVRQISLHDWMLELDHAEANTAPEA